ncbi:hypothetical protein FRB98_008945 [Tulasnella sp. 332]|nr:hypothetical protein FRB98_008945 [Tulasnella sp. 332]
MSSDLQTQQDEIAFFEWFTANGGKISQGSLGLRNFPDTGRGAYALKDIRESEILFEIPRELVLSTRTCDLPRLLGQKDWEEVGSGWAGLILCMMYEEAKGSSGKWAGYFATMPTVFSTLMFWSADELKELEGSTIIGDCAYNITMALGHDADPPPEKIGREEAEAEYFGKVLPVVQRRTDLFDPVLLSSMFSLERYHINGSRILSRSFDVEPGAPDENGEWKTTIGPGQDIEVASVGGSDDDQEDNVESIGMTPFADLLNARYGCDNAHLYYDSTLQMIATEDIPAGTQIWNTYGEPPNSDLLRRYGHVDFVLTPQESLGNPMDVVEIKADLVVDVINAPNSAERVEWFLENDGQDSFDIHYEDAFESVEPDLKDSGMSKPRDEMLSFINLLQLPVDRFEKVKNRSKLPKPNADVQSLQVFTQVVTRRMGQYPTTIEMDEDILARPGNPQNLTNAVIVRLGEKKILRQTLLNLKEEIATLEAKANPKNREYFAEDSSRRIDAGEVSTVYKLSDMSRQSSGRTSFASQAAWSALDVQEGESSDSEVEVTPPAETAPLPETAKSSTARKVATEPPATRAPSKKRAKKASSKTQLKPIPASEEQEQEQPQPEAFAINELASKIIPPAEVNDAADRAAIPESPQSNTPEAPLLSPKSSTSPRARSPVRPINTTTPFAPNLPDTLPHTPSSGLGPRKRKASEDLKSGLFAKDPKVERDAADAANGVTTAVTSNGEKVGVVELALTEAPAGSAVDPEKKKKMQSVVVRTVWTFIMIFGFLFCLAAGPVYMIILVLGIQTQVYREVTTLFGLTIKSKDAPVAKERKQRDPWSKTLNWYFFAITNYFLYGETMIHYFKHVVHADVRFLPFATNHRLISFMLYIFGFVGFVASLKKPFLKQQFGLFGWVHMSLLIVVFSSHFIIDNILEGMIWFWVPASLVICNDIFAYIWGMTLGRTPLISLSPKKTVEGFVGAFFSTVLFSLVWSTLFMPFPYMTCPATDLGINVFTAVQCDLNPAFVWRSFVLPGPVQALFAPLFIVPSIPWAPFHLHALVMATFASLVAPFGGFFASGFKRAFDLKDFGHSIPGHGGLTDRMDCQFIMGMFAYVYYSSVVRMHEITPASVMQMVRSSLTLEEQVVLFHSLKDYLVGMGLENAVKQAIR